jgi:hypothetical protein
MTRSKFVRLRWTTYTRLRKYFPAKPRESAAAYFDRLSMWLERTDIYNWANL